MPRVPTVAIVDPNNDNDFIIINESDFDENTMDKWDWNEETSDPVDEKSKTKKKGKK